MESEIGVGFTWVDYVVFGVMLTVSAGIGLYYGCVQRKENSTKEFLMAGRSMTTGPISLSLMASFMSAVAILGPSAEVYENGFVYWILSLSFPLVALCVSKLYLPVFWNLQVTSAYEYLERRFDRKVRLLASGIFVFQMLLYTSVVIYAPSAALAQVTGIPVRVSVTVVTFVCIFYTTVGGMKAVIWTDALQMLVMFGSVVFIAIMGSLQQGGFHEVWKKASLGNRTEVINFDVDPRTRHTFWTLFVGGFFMWMSLYAVNQTQVQRYMCVQKKEMAIRSLWINSVGLIILMVTSTFCGVVIYSKYAACDVYSSGEVHNSNQLLAYFVVESLGSWIGLPGLFIAGVFSGALSTVSSAINSLAAITLEDFVKGIYPNLNEIKATRLSKIITVFYGLVIYGLTFLAEKLGNVAAAALGIHGIVGGPLLGAFTLGMFFPWANSLGTFVGVAGGMACILWISVGQQISVISGALTKSTLPLTQCSNVTIQLLANFNETSSNVTFRYGEPTEYVADNSVMEIYKISYMWFAGLGFIITIGLGMLISLCTGLDDPRKSNPKLFSPIVLALSGAVGEDFTQNREKPIGIEAISANQKTTGL